MTEGAAQDQAVPELEAEVPVVEVTLLEDRASVVRRGAIELPPGRSRLRIAKVAPVLVDKTLTATLSRLSGTAGTAGTAEPSDMRVRSVSVRRWRVTREADRPPALAELRATRRAKQQAREANNRILEQLADEHQSLETLLALTMSEINEDVGWGRQERGRWGEQLDLLEARAREIVLECRRLGHQNRLIERELGDLQTLEAASSTLGTEVTAELTLELFNPGPIPRKLELGVEYLVPGALWRPWHTARLIEASEVDAKVEFCCAGAVWQATGEDWTDVQLTFSTERPSLGVTPPTLETDRLRFRKKSSTVEVEARDQKVHTAGLGAGDGPVKKELEDELPGIADGGEAVALRGRAKATVPGDGRPYRVPIFSFETEARAELVCAPELVASVMLRSRQQNESKHPLLAGPVDLVRNSGLVGRTSILFIAPGERFELGWGPDSAMRVHRELEELEYERRMMSSWTRKPRRVSVKLSNLTAAAKSVEVKERVAVSEVEKVEVEVTEASRGAKPDDDGFVTWDVQVPGFGREELELTWVLVVHDDVVGL